MSRANKCPFMDDVMIIMEDLFVLSHVLTRNSLELAKRIDQEGFCVIRDKGKPKYMITKFNLEKEENGAA